MQIVKVKDCRSPRITSSKLAMAGIGTLFLVLVAFVWTVLLQTPRGATSTVSSIKGIGTPNFQSSATAQTSC